MSAASRFHTFVALRIIHIFLLPAALILASVPPSFAATKEVVRDPNAKPAKTVQSFSRADASQTSSAANGALRILLVDDDVSDNNNIPGDTRKSASDIVFRKLVADAVGGDTAAWAIETVKTNANGPGIDKLRNYSLIVWYTGASYGGNPDNTSVLSIEDEKTVRRYLQETGGAVILISPGYASKVLEQGSSWEQTSWPFLTEVLGIQGGRGLVQRFLPGTVTTTQGTKFEVGKGGAVESQFSAVNPAGATVVFTSDIEAMGGKPVPVATANSYGKGRIIYVGFTFENLAAKQLAPAFQQLIAATGLTGQLANTNTVNARPLKNTMPGKQFPAIGGTGTTTTTPPAALAADTAAPAATEPNPKLTFTGLTYFKTAKVKIYTGNDNKEALSHVTVVLSVNGGESDDNGGLNPDRLVRLARFFLPNQALQVNSLYESVMEISPGGFEQQFKYIQANSWGEQDKITLDRCQQYGLRLEINYEPNFILDAWKIDRVDLEIDFGYWEWWFYRGDRESGSHSERYLVSKPAAGYPRIISFNRSSLLNGTNNKLTLITDGFFFPK